MQVLRFGQPDRRPTTRRGVAQRPKFLARILTFMNVLTTPICQFFEGEIEPFGDSPVAVDVRDGSFLKSQRHQSPFLPQKLSHSLAQSVGLACISASVSPMLCSPSSSSHPRSPPHLRSPCLCRR